MKVKVIGKENIYSKKSDKEFTVVHFLSNLKGENKEGSKPDSAWLNGSDYPYSTIKVGSTYNIDRDGQGRVVEIEIVQ